MLVSFNAPGPHVGLASAVGNDEEEAVGHRPSTAPVEARTTATSNSRITPDLRTARSVGGLLIWLPRRIGTLSVPTSGCDRRYPAVQPLNLSRRATASSYSDTR